MEDRGATRVLEDSEPIASQDKHEKYPVMYRIANCSVCGKESFLDLDSDVCYWCSGGD